MPTENQTNYCPCGKLWPCRCDLAWKMMGFGKRPPVKDDEDVVATLECPKCHDRALLTIDPDCVEGAELIDGKWIVNDAGGPPMGECCDLIFAMQPGGEIEVFKVPKQV